MTCLSETPPSPNIIPISSANLLDKVPAGYIPPTQPAPVSVQGENYVSALQELLQRNHMATPRYRFRNGNGGFSLRSQ